MIIEESVCFMSYEPIFFAIIFMWYIQNIYIYIFSSAEHCAWAIISPKELDFKSKSQNIWLQRILFSSTVMQMICARHKIWTLSGRLSLMRNVQLMKRFVMNSKTNLKHFLYTKLKSIIDWFLSLHDDKINKDFGNKLRT
jgi:hypothetical protein